MLKWISQTNAHARARVQFYSFANVALPRIYLSLFRFRIRKRFHLSSSNHNRTASWEIQSHAMNIHENEKRKGETRFAKKRLEIRIRKS